MNDEEAGSRSEVESQIYSKDAIPRGKIDPSFV